MVLRRRQCNFQRVQNFCTEAFLPVIDELINAFENKISVYELVYERKKTCENIPKDLEASLRNEIIQLKNFAHLYTKGESEPPTF